MHDGNLKYCFTFEVSQSLNSGILIFEPQSNAKVRSITIRLMYTEPGKGHASFIF